MNDLIKEQNMSKQLKGKTCGSCDKISPADESCDDWVPTDEQMENKGISQTDVVRKVWKRIPIKEAKELGKKLGMERVVLVLQEPEGRQHVVTWGRKYDDCTKAACIGNCIKKIVLGWPDELCHAKPARQIRAERTANMDKYYGKNNKKDS